MKELGGEEEKKPVSRICSGIKKETENSGLTAVAGFFPFARLSSSLSAGLGINFKVGTQKVFIGERGAEVIDAGLVERRDVDKVVAGFEGSCRLRVKSIVKVLEIVLFVNKYEQHMKIC